MLFVMKILVADDEAKMLKLAVGYLEAEGFVTFAARDGRQALDLFAKHAPDCVILDIMMPGMDGVTAAREMLKTSDTPIIFLTAKSGETDRVVGLELGADDYIVKPFSPRELVARVRAVLRRGRRHPSPEAGGNILEVSDVVLNMKKRTVLVRGEPKDLTTIQFDVLALLMSEPGRVFTRLQILEAVVEASFDGYERTIDGHIKNIRKALGDERDDPRYIGTVRGVGYKFIEPSP
jgi:two-component system, OmpR family, response regulator RegX3